MIWDLKLKTPQIDSPTWCDVDRFTAIVLESPIITAQTLETIQPTKEPTNNHQEKDLEHKMLTVCIKKL